MCSAFVCVDVFSVDALINPLPLWRQDILEDKKIRAAGIR